MQTNGKEFAGYANSATVNGSEVMIPTLSVAEATEKLRALGVKISPDTLRLGLQQGVYPFGVHIKSERAPVYQVYAKLLDAWIAERAVPVSEPMYDEEGKE